MKTNALNSVSRTFHKIGFKLKQHSPEILVTAGVIGTVASTVLACRATTKLSAILDETKETTAIIRDGMETGDIRGHKYTEEEGQKDLTITYAQTGLKIAKLYAPAVILGVLSLTAIVSSNHILRKRNVALAAAYATVDKGFKEYRSRVVERFGKELDRELRYNIKAREIEETVVDENGEEKTFTKTVDVVDINEPSDYARFFDDGCTGWVKDAELNLVTLKQQQAFANEKLRSQGWLFLNDVYKSLGIPQTRAGQVVGWIYDEKHPIGDNYVDFGIYDTHKESNRNFVNGHERTILLDFNVDGNIMNHLPF